MTETCTETYSLADWNPKPDGEIETGIPGAIFTGATYTCELAKDHGSYHEADGGNVRWLT